MSLCDYMNEHPSLQLFQMPLSPKYAQLDICHSCPAYSISPQYNIDLEISHISPAYRPKLAYWPNLVYPAPSSVKPRKHQHVLGSCCSSPPNCDQYSTLREDKTNKPDNFSPFQYTRTHSSRLDRWKLDPSPLKALSFFIISDTNPDNEIWRGKRKNTRSWVKLSVWSPTDEEIWILCHIECLWELYLGTILYMSYLNMESIAMSYHGHICKCYEDGRILHNHWVWSWINYMCIRAVMLIELNMKAWRPWRHFVLPLKWQDKENTLTT